MIYLLVLPLFWKPIYCLVMSLVKRDSSYLKQISTWAQELAALVNPVGFSW